jgi:hypothetical protein
MIGAEARFQVSDAFDFHSFGHALQKASGFLRFSLLSRT